MNSRLRFGPPKVIFAQTSGSRIRPMSMPFGFEIVTPLYQIRNRRPGYKCSMIKTAMTLCGLQGGRVRAPLIEMQPEDRRDLEVLLEKVGLLKPVAVSR